MKNLNLLTTEFRLLTFGFINPIGSVNPVKMVFAKQTQFLNSVKIRIICGCNIVYSLCSLFLTGKLFKQTQFLKSAQSVVPISSFFANFVCFVVKLFCAKQSQFLKFVKICVFFRGKTIFSNKANSTF